MSNGCNSPIDDGKGATIKSEQCPLFWIHIKCTRESVFKLNSKAKYLFKMSVARHRLLSDNKNVLLQIGKKRGNSFRTNLDADVC